MESVNEKNHKTKKSIRDAVKRHGEKMKINDPEKYNKLREWHKEYSRKYYQELKEAREMMKKLKATQ